MVRLSAWRGAMSASLLLALVSGTAVQAGPDVIVGDIIGTSNNGSTGGKASWAIGTTSCNLGDQELTWNSGTNQHPVISQNLYRLSNGRFEQIGQAWLKHGFCALQGTVCSSSCSPSPLGCGALGVLCSDPYSSGLNNDQSGLGPKSEVNAATGAFPYPWVNNGTGSGILFKRLQASTADLGTAGASYYVSSMYVQPQDAAAGNDNNNESYRPCTIGAGPGYTMSLTGTTQREKPGIQAWKDADASVVLTNVDVSGDGRFIIGSKVTSLGGGQYHFEYAVQNLNSDRSGQSFTIPFPAGTVITNVGFRDVDYHSGEPYSLTDWSVSQTSTSITWSTQTFATNANANALRWDTIYNFRFDANVAGGTGGATIGLFKPGSPASVNGLALVPGGGPIPPPSNDACANAVTVGAGQTAFDTTSATTDGPTETLCNFSGSDQITTDIWFRYTATSTGATVVSTCGSTFDTKLAIYPNATCPAGVNTALLCNDDSNTCATNSLQSLLTLNAVSGTTYLIRVGGYQNAVGAGVLNITPPGPVAPANNNCANATVINYPSTTSFNTANATTDGPNEATACNFFGYTDVGSDVWFKFVACASGTITASTCGANFDSKLAVYAGATCPTAASAIACNDDNGPSCQTTASSVSFTAVSGQTYIIRLGGYNGATGSGSLVLSGPSCPVVPSNNDCANRAGIGLGALTVSTTNATTDGPATGPCGQIGQDIWYNHPATCTGRLTITMCGSASTFDSMLAVYANTGCANLSTRLITCNNDGPGATCSGGRSEISFNIVQGRNYTIRLGGLAAASGTGTLTLSCVPHCRGDWNGDGVVTPADVAAFVNDWSNSLGTGTLLGDYDNDGNVAPADVAAFVTQWSSDLAGPCS